MRFGAKNSSIQILMFARFLSLRFSRQKPIIFFCTKRVHIFSSSHSTKHNHSVNHVQHFESKIKRSIPSKYHQGERILALSVHRQSCYHDKSLFFCSTSSCRLHSSPRRVVLLASSCPSRLRLVILPAARVLTYLVFFSLLFLTTSDASNHIGSLVLLMLVFDMLVLLESLSFLYCCRRS